MPICFKMNALVSLLTYREQQSSSLVNRNTHWGETCVCQEGLRTRRVGGSLSLSEDEVDSEAELYDPLNKRGARWDHTLRDLCKALYEHVQADAAAH